MTRYQIGTSLAVFFAAAIFLTGCLVAGTDIQVSSPLNNATVEINKEVQVAVIARDEIGVTRVELWDEGVVYASQQSTVVEGQQTLPVTFRWTTKSVGNHLLVIKAYNRQSSDRESKIAVLNLVVIDPSQITPTPPPTITNTPSASPTTTRSPTSGPSPTATAAPSLTPTTIATTPAPPTPASAPTAPTNFTARGTGTTIQFQWQDNATDELGFRIYEQGVVAPIADNIAPHVSTGGTFLSVANLPCNKNASYTIRAFNAVGESAPSNPATAFTIPCAPTNLSVTSASSTSVNLSFQTQGTADSGYRVYQTNSATPLGMINAATTPGVKSGSINNIPCGTTYAYVVRAFNAAGESSNSNTSEVTTNGCNVTIAFTQIHVIKGGDGPVAGCGTLVPRLDCGNKGDVWLDIVVNGQLKRWPPTGNPEINDDETKPITGISYAFTFTRGQNLTISVSGTDKDSFSSDDPLGTVTKTYAGTDNWGAGTHTEKTVCTTPGGCYEITFTIEVKP